ncbi:MAG: DEDD exonuclease domain-containing protein [Acidimicrobiales bacterium]|jgi:DNA polymerase-3 subunit epsilon|nr:DEDD exonuclease domain-containing protein [Acidimicrobiales bacterium]
MAPPVQRSFDDLGTPLHDVTFCVLDLETTGASARTCAITEIGAVKVRGGMCLGTFQTLVNPGQAIPPAITVLTGITEAMVVPAPRIESVLPSLLEFLGQSVVVGHNVRFDLSFLQAALAQTGYPRLTNRSIDTCALARRLVRDEVPNCRLGTLAERLRLDHRPNHRALDDALATVDLLHALLERVGNLGVTGLDDLTTLPTIHGHAQAHKLKLTSTLPRSPGVYLFRDRHGSVLYVGKATDLRARVRSYFSSDDRRKVAQLLRETERIDHEVCTSALEAAVREVRLIHELTPRFNRQSKDWSRYVYLKLTLAEPFPRLSVVRAVRDDGGLYLGPLPSASFARRVAEAVETVIPLRRCSSRPGRRGGERTGPCTAQQLGVALCPCSGGVTPEAYDHHVQRAVRGLTTDPDLLFAPLAERMALLAADERFEEAADVRDRAAALSAALRRQRRFEGLRRAGHLVIELPGRVVIELDGGRFVSSAVRRAHRGDDAPPALPFPTPRSGPRTGPDLGAADDGCSDAEFPSWTPIPRELADELACVASWLDQRAGTVRVLHSDVGLASPLPRLPVFEPAPADRATTRRRGGRGATATPMLTLPGAARVPARSQTRGSPVA